MFALLRSLEEEEEEEYIDSVGCSVESDAGRNLVAVSIK